MNKPLVLKLPWPVSVNHYYDFIIIPSRKGGHRHISKKISNRGIAFQAEVLIACRVNGELRERFGDARLRLSVQCHPPTRRKFDLDNLGKSLQDSLQKAGVYDDDGQIDELHFYRKGSEKPGYVIVTLEVMPTAMQNHWAGKTKKDRNIDKKPEGL